MSGGKYRKKCMKEIVEQSLHFPHCSSFFFPLMMMIYWVFLSWNNLKFRTKKRREDREQFSWTDQNAAKSFFLVLSIDGSSEVP